MVSRDHVEPSGASEVVATMDVVSDPYGSGNGSRENPHDPNQVSRASHVPRIVVPWLNLPQFCWAI